MNTLVLNTKSSTFGIYNDDQKVIEKDDDDDSDIFPPSPEAVNLANKSLLFTPKAPSKYRYKVVKNDRMSNTDSCDSGKNVPKNIFETEDEIDNISERIENININPKLSSKKSVHFSKEQENQLYDLDNTSKITKVSKPKRTSKNNEKLINEDESSTKSESKRTSRTTKMTEKESKTVKNINKATRDKDQNQNHTEKKIRSVPTRKRNTRIKESEESKSDSLAKDNKNEKTLKAQIKSEPSLPIKRSSRSLRRL